MKKIVIVFIITLLLPPACRNEQLKEPQRSFIKRTEQGVVIDNEEFLILYVTGLSLFFESSLREEERGTGRAERFRKEGQSILEDLFKAGTIISTDNGGFFFRTDNKETIYFTMQQDEMIRKARVEEPGVRLIIPFQIDLSKNESPSYKKFQNVPISVISEGGMHGFNTIILEDFNKLKKFYGSIKIKQIPVCTILSIK